MVNIVSYLTGDHPEVGFIQAAPVTHGEFECTLQEFTKTLAGRQASMKNAKMADKRRYSYMVAIMNSLEEYPGQQLSEEKVWPEFVKAMKKYGLENRVENKYPIVEQGEGSGMGTGGGEGIEHNVSVPPILSELEMQRLAAEQARLEVAAKRQTLHPKPKGSGYNESPAMKFANQPETKIETGTGTAMSICDSYVHMTDYIATVYLGGGRALKVTKKNHGYIKIIDPIDTQKFLAASHSPQQHSTKVTSVRRCVAISAGYILDKYFSHFDDLSTIKEEDYHTVPANTLADAHGLTKQYPVLYLCYNIGLEYMVQERPSATLALLAWRGKHYETLLGSQNAENKIEVPSHAAQISQAVTYLHMYCSEMGLDRDSFLEEVTQQAIVTARYLKRVEPTKGGSRIAAATQFDEAYFSRIFNTLA